MINISLNNPTSVYLDFKTFSVSCWLYYRLKRGSFYSVEILSRIKKKKLLFKFS